MTYLEIHLVGGLLSSLVDVWCIWQLLLSLEDPPRDWMCRYVYPDKWVVRSRVNYIFGIAICSIGAIGLFATV
jgi:hypothetical protein